MDWVLLSICARLVCLSIPVVRLLVLSVSVCFGDSIFHPLVFVVWLLAPTRSDPILVHRRLYIHHVPASVSLHIHLSRLDVSMSIMFVCLHMNPTLLPATLTPLTRILPTPLNSPHPPDERGNKMNVFFFISFSFFSFFFFRFFIYQYPNHTPFLSFSFFSFVYYPLPSPLPAMVFPFFFSFTTITTTTFALRCYPLLSLTFSHSISKPHIRLYVSFSSSSFYFCLGWVLLFFLDPPPNDDDNNIHKYLFFRPVPLCPDSSLSLIPTRFSQTHFNPFRPNPTQPVPPHAVVVIIFFFAPPRPYHVLLAYHPQRLIFFLFSSLSLLLSSSSPF